MAATQNRIAPHHLSPLGVGFHHRSQLEGQEILPTVNLDLEFNFEFFFDLALDQLDQLLHVTTSRIVTDHDVITVLLVNLCSSNSQALQASLVNQALCRDSTVILKDAAGPEVSHRMLSTFLDPEFLNSACHLLRIIHFQLKSATQYDWLIQIRLPV
jgi:hypothetical protein